MNTTAPIGFICAMESEADLLIRALENKTCVTIAGGRFHSGTLHGTPAVVVQCGIGKVNAARCTQALIDRFAPGAVINSGIAGGIGDGLFVGDIVIGTELVEHDFDLSALGYTRGNVCDGKKTKPTFFKSDKKLTAAIKTAAEKLAPDRGVHEGVIASGDVFVADKQTKNFLRESFGALAAEMEGASVAHTAQYAGVPFAVIRVISDLADGGAPASYSDFETETAAFSAKLMLSLAEACA